MNVDYSIKLAFAGAAAVAIVTGVVSFFSAEKHDRTWWSNWFQGISNGMVGAIITAILFSLIVGAAQQSQMQAEQKADLIVKAGSTAQNVAISALEELRVRGYVQDGSLDRTIFTETNLAGANFGHASLVASTFEGGDLHHADFQSADITSVAFEGVNLQYAMFGYATANNATFSSSDLRHADLSAAELENTNFCGADLRGVTFRYSDLINATFSECHSGPYTPKDSFGVIQAVLFDTTTELPNGEFWHYGTDMRQFTDPSNINFWQSDFHYTPDGPN